MNKKYLSSNQLADTVARLVWMKAEIEAWRNFAVELLGDDDFVSSCPGEARRARELIESAKVDSDSSCLECGSGPGGPA